MAFAEDLEMAAAAVRNMDSVSAEGLNAEDVGGDNASQQQMENHPLPEETVSNDDQVQEDEVEIKKALKFSYAAIFPTLAGLLSIFTGYFGKETDLGPAGIFSLDVTAFLMLTALFSAGSMTLLASVRPWRPQVLIRVLKGLKYVTLAFLVLAGVDIAFVFLRYWLLLAAAIPLVVIAVIMLSRHLP